MKKTNRNVLRLFWGISFSLLWVANSTAGGNQILPLLEKELTDLVMQAQRVSVGIVAQTEVVQRTQSDATPSSSSHKIISKTIGSGFIFDPSGYILTKQSVVEGADKISVLLFNGDSLRAELVGIDPLLDLAVLRVQKHDLPAPVFAPPEALHVGSWVLTLGKSVGLSTAVSFGMVQGMTQDGFLHVGIQVSPGIIGAPIFNFQGQIVGILFARVLLNADSAFPGYADFYYRKALALPVAQIRARVQRLIDESRQNRGWLGVTVTHKHGRPVSDTLLVTHVFAHSPAQRAGIKPGDLLLECNGTPVRNLNQLLRLVKQQKPRSEISLCVLRNGRKIHLRVQLTQRPRFSVLQKALHQDSAFSPQGSNAKNLSSGNRRQILTRLQTLEKEIHLLKKQVEKR